MTVSFPRCVCVEPGSTVSIDLSAEIAPDLRDRYEITQLFFKGLRHPQRGAPDNNFGARWSDPNAGNVVQGKGTLRWTPGRADLDDDLRPYTAKFVAVAKERDEFCDGIGIVKWCDEKKVYFETDIVISWGQFPANATYPIRRQSGAIEIGASANVDFQPQLVVRAVQNDAGRFVYGIAALEGTISFTNNVYLKASRQDVLELSTAGNRSDPHPELCVPER